MFQSPLISIITPCYNAASFLQEAINSVLSQTYSHFEWILVNDGSTDETEAIIKLCNDTRIRYYSQQNRGQCAAANFALSKATGDYIKFFDADDVMNAEHLNAQLVKLNGHSESLASCAWARFYDGRLDSAKFIGEPVWKDMQSIDWIKQSLSQQYDMMGAWLWLIPRAVIQKTGGWDERLSLNNDFEFSMRLLFQAKEVRFAGDAKLYYRSGNVSLSQSSSIQAFKEAILSTDLGCSYLLAKEDSRLTRQLCADRYQEWLYRIYPFDQQLVAKLEQKIHDLGGSKRRMDGGTVQQLLCRLLGWKRTKRLKNFLRSKGYSKLPFN